MKKFLKFCIIIFLVSCETEKLIPEDSKSELFKIENEILSFKNTNDLKTIVEKLKNEKEKDEVIKSLKQSYDNGFLPLNPQIETDDLLSKIITIKKERNLNLKNSKLHKTIIVDDEMFEVEDDLILDDEFASFLSINREIIVNDTLYTYSEKGIFKTHKNNLSKMRDFVLENDIPEYTTLPTPGSYDTSDNDITLVIPSYNPCGGSLSASLANNSISHFDEQNLICFNANLNNNFWSSIIAAGTNLCSTANLVNHSESLLNYVNTLTPCSPSNNLGGIFGPDKRCWSYFDSGRRTKTIFYKHNYIIYRAIGVKVKHQKRHWLGWWYASDDNDEVAMIIDKAYFKIKPTVNPINVHNQSLNKYIFFNGLVYNNNAQLIGSATSLNFQLPSLPLNAQFIISDFIHNNTGITLSPNQVKNLIYQQTWNQLKSILNSNLAPSGIPKSVNYYVYDTSLNEIHFMHINLEDRRTCSKKIVRTFDYNFNVAIKFNVYNSGSIYGNSNISASFSFPPGLFEYKEADIDFTGLSRKGNLWRGSKLVFKD
ncbi:MAG: hypothetical protein KGZ81_13315 [Flavobacteriales bacterium]|nr:hypothetical protein [Flavobacteriales bacterium]